MPNIERVVVGVEGAVAHVELNRPDKRNALDVQMFQGLLGAGRQLISNRDIRAVVVSGRGQAFCAGLDFLQFVHI